MGPRWLLIQKRRGGVGKPPVTRPWQSKCTRSVSPGIQINRIFGNEDRPAGAMQLWIATDTLVALVKSFGGRMSFVEGVDDDPVENDLHGEFSPR